MILSPTKTFSESNPAAANSSPRSKVRPKGFTPRGEQLTLSAFNEYANVGKKQSRTMGTSMRNDEFDDIDGNDEDEDVNNKNSKKRDRIWYLLFLRVLFAERKRNEQIGF